MALIEVTHPKYGSNES